MKTGIATVSISGNLDEKIAAIASAGFTGIEIFEQDFIADARSPREIGARVRDAGLEVLLFQPFRDFEGLPEPLRAKAFDRFERKFDLMADLGTDLVLVCSSVHPAALGGIDRAADDFAQLGERAALRGMRVGFEALAWGRHISDHRDAWEIVRRADHANIGLILDSFHTLGRKIDPETIRRIPGDKIFFVQLADAPQIDMDLLYWSRHFRNMPGEGDLNIPAFMAAVMATGYKGPVSLEIFNDQFRGGNTKMLAQDGYRSIIALMDDVRRRQPDAAFSLPERANYLPPIPARAQAKGVSFVEFTARGPEAVDLAAQLTALGFAKAGQHRSKDVALWTQGDIRLLINQQTTGYAANAWAARGTSVCDIGLEVDDTGQTLARAVALGATPFVQQNAPEDAAIPALRGLEGSLLHVMDPTLQSVWATEFSAPSAPHQGTGLRRIDHLAQTTQFADMLSWSLFYTAMLHLDRTPMVDVIDPDGLVRSCALASKDGALRITLNGADTHRTLAGSLMASSFGAPVQHIAFATDHIFATLDALAQNGFAPLEIPANYYDDLAARFDFPPGVLDQMQAANVLYDREEGGEFWQCYANNFAGGLFFEIVQRGAGYRGYGGPNAPFRVAAQKRLLRSKGMPLR